MNAKPEACDHELEESVSGQKTGLKPSVEKRFPCDQCDYKTKFKQSLKKHVRSVHDKLRPYECEFCGKTFGNSSNLCQHRRKHTGEKPFKCDQCEYATAWSNTLKKHKKKHCMPSVKVRRTYKCETCNKTFKSGQHLNVHQRIHTGEKPFRCDHCPFQTAYPESLKSHINNRHTKSKKLDALKCNICAATFSEQRCLDRHSANMHDDHECVHCGRKFEFSFDLKRHLVNLHEGEGLYKCDICDTSFVKNRNLQDHRRRSHVVKKPLKCDRCDFKTANSYGLNIHIQRVHGHNQIELDGDEAVEEKDREGSTMPDSSEQFMDFVDVKLEVKLEQEFDDLLSG